MELPQVNRPLLVAGQPLGRVPAVHQRLSQGVVVQRVGDFPGTKHALPDGEGVDVAAAEWLQPRVADESVAGADAAVVDGHRHGASGVTGLHGHVGAFVKFLIELLREGIVVVVVVPNSQHVELCSLKHLCFPILTITQHKIFKIKGREIH